jgi:hypothetical protein
MTPKLLCGLCALALALCLSPRGLTAQTNPTVFFEDFESVTVPALPAGWQVVNNGWRTGTATASPGGGNNLEHSGTIAGFLTLPSLNFSAVSGAELSYFARRTSSYARENLRIVASVDGGATFPVVLADEGAALPEGTSWALITLPLPAALENEPLVRLRFEGFGGTSSSANIRLDDIRIRAAAPVFAAIPPQLTFFADPGTVGQESVVIRNDGLEPLAVQAPFLSGGPFTVSPATGATLMPGEEITYEIAFAPVEAALYHESLIFAHNGVESEAVILLSASSLEGHVGFIGSSAEAVELGTATIGLRLNASDEEGLHGLQLRLTLEGAEAAWEGVRRGEAVASAGEWTLQYEIDGAELRAVLVSTTVDGLPQGTYEPVLLLDVAALQPTNGTPVLVRIEEVVASLATPTGDDAGLGIRDGVFALDIRARRAFIAADLASVDFGQVIAGQMASATIRLSNPGGERPVAIQSVDVGGVFAYDLSADEIEPDGTVDLEVRFEPTLIAFGYREALLTVQHDGENGPITVDLRGTGIFGRGDLDGDGLVDIADVITGVDAAIRRVSLVGPALIAGDVFPFPGGDERYDVRDVTVLLQAVLRDEWPDGVRLPVPAPPAPEEPLLAMAAKRTAADVRLKLTGSTSEIRLHLANEVPIRGFQMRIRSEAAATLHVDASTAGLPEGTIIQAGRSAEGEHTILVYRMDGGIIPAGTASLGMLVRERTEMPVSVPFVVAVDLERFRLPVSVANQVGTTAEPGERPSRFSVGAPYPNPLVTGAGQEVAIPLEVAAEGPVVVEVFDAVGRLVWRAEHHMTPGRPSVSWTGQAPGGGPLPPGAYFLRLSANGRSETRTVMLVR